MCLVGIVLVLCDVMFVIGIILYCLFGVIFDLLCFCYYCDNLLLFDVVVVDEVLMIDLLLMIKLVDVVVFGIWLVLFGDLD